MGFYTDRRWKIHTTSHGILLIATLLVPLNFLAIAAFTQTSPPSDVLTLAGEALSFVIFSALVWWAGKILVPNEAGPLTVGVMVPCVMQLLVRRFAEPDSSLGVLFSLAVVPVASYLATIFIAVRPHWASVPTRPVESITTGAAVETTAPLSASMVESTAQRLLKLLGLISAATLLPLALLLTNIPPLRSTLHWLSPPYYRVRSSGDSGGPLVPQAAYRPCASPPCKPLASASARLA